VNRSTAGKDKDVDCASMKIGRRTRETKAMVNVSGFMVLDFELGTESQYTKNTAKSQGLAMHSIPGQAIIKIYNFAP
jgi:hypothetical protein